MEKHPCVYILASRRFGTLYVGVTSNLIQRIWQHRNDFVEGFTQRYKIHTLVWYEQHENMESAILREKEVKKWQRHAKITLIENSNPEWRDLWEDLAHA
jgi:putative endonuclease